MAEPASRIKVLVVEDEGVLSGYIEDVLEGGRFEVIGVATTGIEALEVAERTHPDLALVDLSLGEGTAGVEIARLLRERFGAALVLVNGVGPNETDMYVSATGATPADILHRPFLPRHLLRVLEAAVERLGR